MEGASTIFTNLFWLTIAFLFLSAIVGTVVVHRQKDRCLKLFHDFHASLQMSDGRAIWGDVHVYSQGLEIRFDEGAEPNAATGKSTYLLYEPELANVLAMARYVGELTPDEAALRQKQVVRRSNPGPMRRAWRGIRNFVNTVRDAFSQTLSMVVGQVSKTGKSDFMKSQKGGVEKLGQTLLGTAGNAWEPLLERHIGKPVVVELNAADKSRIELSGYLAEYSGKYITLFNIEHPVQETIEIEVAGPVERPDLKLEKSEDNLLITNLATVPLVVESLTQPGKTSHVGAVLAKGAFARLPFPPAGATLKLLRVSQLDVVCPRTSAAVRHGAR